MQRLISGLATLFPQKYKEALLGSPADPSWLANVIHSLLNMLPVERFPVLPCDGVLKGYRMKIDWHKHRSFIYGTWEPEVGRAISEVVSEGNVAIDIGAHSGFYTLLLSKLVGREGMVIAFEPLPENFRMLEENIRLNQCSRIKPINKAVMDRSCKMELSIPDKESLLVAGPVVNGNRGKTVTVEAVSIDDFMYDLKSPVHFIKMDVEGAEGLILRGAIKTIEMYHPIMFIEIHHFDGYDENNEVVALLNGLRYEIHWLDRYPITSHIVAKWTGAHV
jgi:FkbM family methyltransferase